MLAKIVLRNVTYNTLAILTANVSGLIVTIYVARILKPELFGIYSLAISVTFLILSFADLGINGTVTRYVSEALKIGDIELVRGYIRSLGFVKLVLTLFASLILLAIAIHSEIIFKKEIELNVLIPFLIFFSFTGYINSIFNGFNDFKPGFIRTFVYEITRLVAILTLVKSFSVFGALVGFVIASFSSLVVLLHLTIKRISLFGEVKRVEWRRVVRFTSYLTLGSITWVVFAYVDTVMIGMFLPAEDVGFYRAAFNIVNAVSGLISIPAVLFPVFVQLEGKDLNNAFNRVFKYSAIVTFPVVFALIISSNFLITVVYGKEYIHAVPVLSVLSLLLFRSSLGFWGIIFNAKEKPEYPVYVSFVAMLLNVVLNYFMILAWGIIGAGLATLISNLMSWIALAYLSKKHFGIFFDWNHLAKPILAGILMFSILKQFENLELPILVTFGLFVYLTILFLIKGISVEDLKYLAKVIP